MINKILDFLKGKSVKTITLIVFAVASAVLIIDGLSLDNLAEICKAVLGVLTAVATIIKIIISFITVESVDKAVDKVATKVKKAIK